MLEIPGKNFGQALESSKAGESWGKLGKAPESSGKAKESSGMLVAARESCGMPGEVSESSGKLGESLGRLVKAPGEARVSWRRLGEAQTLEIPGKSSGKLLKARKLGKAR